MSEQMFRMNRLSMYQKSNRGRMNVLIVLTTCLTIQAQEIVQTTIPWSTVDQTARTEIWTSSEMIDVTTFENQIIPSKQQWMNINRNSSLQWRQVNDDSNTYLIRSEGQCLSQMCQIKLKYNGSLVNENEACLSFILWIHDQPFGQLWIEEDEEKESFSQKIQLSNSTLYIQHSFQSNLKQLSIDGRILFQNAQLDTITISNLKIDWNGPCPKYSSGSPSEQSTQTSEEEWLTSTSTNDEPFETTESENVLSTSTRRIVERKMNSLSKSFVDERTFIWLLTLVISFCLFIISLSFLYGIWSIQKHYRHIWYLPYERPIQFLWRRSIRSSTRSQPAIETLSQIATDLQLEFSEDSIHISTADTSPSTSSMWDSVLF